MKMILKIMGIDRNISGLAANYVMPKVDGRTKKDLKRKAKSIQNKSQVTC